MSEIIEHDEETGLTLKLVHDEIVESPLTWSDHVLFAILHRRYVNPAAKFAGADLNTVEGIAAFEKANSKPGSEWVTIPLYMIDHSGTAYRASYSGNPFHCPWDSGRVGIIAFKRSEFSAEPRLRAQRPGYWLEIAKAWTDEYTAWANGDCWGYVIEDEDGEEVDDGACWGFIGYDYAAEQAREAFAGVLKAARAELAGVLEAERPDLYAGA